MDPRSDKGVFLLYSESYYSGTLGAALTEMTDNTNYLRRYLFALLAWALSFCLFLAFCVKTIGQSSVIFQVLANGVFLISSIALLISMNKVVQNEVILGLMLIGGLVGSYYLVVLLGDKAVRMLVQGPVLMCTAYGGARLLVTRIERSWHIGAAALMGLVADIWSVFAPSGLTRTMLEHRPDVLNYLLVGFPIPGSGVRPIIGIADYVFFAIFLLHAEKFGFGFKKAVIALTLSLVVTLVAVNALGLGLPAIPFMATFFVVANLGRLWQDFKKDYAAGFQYEKKQ